MFTRCECTVCGKVFKSGVLCKGCKSYLDYDPKRRPIARVLLGRTRSNIKSQKLIDNFKSLPEATYAILLLNNRWFCEYMLALAVKMNSKVLDAVFTNFQTDTFNNFKYDKLDVMLINNGDFICVYKQQIKVGNINVIIRFRTINMKFTGVTLMGIVPYKINVSKFIGN
jgi:hypothetical protein